MSKTYLVNGKEVSSLKEVAVELGVPRVTTRDIEAGLYPGVIVYGGDNIDEEPELEVLDEVETSLDNATEDEVAVATEEVENTDEEEEEEPPLETPSPKLQGKPAVISDVTYPEKGTYKEKKPLQKFIKKLSIDELMEWADLEGILSDIKVTDHEAIWRMRVAMAIVELHFPKEKTGGKSKSKYAAYTTEQLVQMTMDNDLEVKDAKGDLRILRMYCIMALRDAKLLG